MLQPPTSSSVSDTNFHTNLFGKCVHLMPSPVTVRKRNRMWNEATSVRTRWGFQKHLSKKVASWSGWMSPNGQPWRMILLEAIILQILFHTIYSLPCNPNPSRFLDIFLSWNMDLFQLLKSCISTPVLAGSHSAVSFGSQLAIQDCGGTRDMRALTMESYWHTALPATKHSQLFERWTVPACCPFENSKRNGLQCLHCRTRGT